MKNSLVFEYREKSGKRKMRSVIPEKELHFSDLDGYSFSALEDGVLKEFEMNRIERFCEPFKNQSFFSSTTYIVDKDFNFFLMLHKKLGKFVPPGGKIDNDELPAEGAVREVFEETGLHVNLISSAYNQVLEEVQPFGIQNNIIQKNIRTHVDLIYLGIAENKDELKIDFSEAQEYGWFNVEKVKSLDTFDLVKKWCLYFYDFLKNYEKTN